MKQETILIPWSRKDTLDLIHMSLLLANPNRLSKENQEEDDDIVDIEPSFVGIYKSARKALLSLPFDANLSSSSIPVGVEVYELILHYHFLLSIDQTLDLRITFQHVEDILIE